MTTFTQPQSLLKVNVMPFLPFPIIGAVMVWTAWPADGDYPSWLMARVILMAPSFLFAAVPLSCLLEERRRRVTFDRDGLTSRTLWRSRRIPWADLVGVEPRTSLLGMRSLVAVTTAGTVPLAVPFMYSQWSGAGREDFDAVTTRVDDLVRSRR